MKYIGSVLLILILYKRGWHGNSHLLNRYRSFLSYRNFFKVFCYNVFDKQHVYRGSLETLRADKASIQPCARGSIAKPTASLGGEMRRQGNGQGRKLYGHDGTSSSNTKRVRIYYTDKYGFTTRNEYRHCSTAIAISSTGGG